MSDSSYDKGLATRRAVLGAEYVDKALGTIDAYSAGIQQLVTSFAWGDVWTRPDLERAQRSLITIALLTALNRPHELKVHVAGGLRNGLTPAQIVETITHCAVYCGFPAALDALRVAREVLPPPTAS